MVEMESEARGAGPAIPAANGAHTGVNQAEATAPGVLAEGVRVERRRQGARAGSLSACLLPGAPEARRWQVNVSPIVTALKTEAPALELMRAQYAFQFPMLASPTQIATSRNTVTAIAGRRSLSVQNAWSVTAVEIPGLLAIQSCIVV